MSTAKRRILQAECLQLPLPGLDDDPNAEAMPDDAILASRAAYQAFLQRMGAVEHQPTNLGVAQRIEIDERNGRGVKDLPWDAQL